MKAKYIPTQEMIFLVSKLAETLSLKFWGQENRKYKIEKKKNKRKRWTENQSKMEESCFINYNKSKWIKFICIIGKELSDYIKN